VLHFLWYLAIAPGIPTLLLLVWMKRFAHRRDQRSRRPFEEMPRPAGWSLQQRTADLMESFTVNLLGGFAVSTTFWAIAAFGKGSPYVMLGTGLIACTVLFYRAFRLIWNYSNHRLGLLGEQLVGRILDQLSSESIRVFHDLEVREPGGKPWNIDHVVVTPAAVFAIETKTRRKARGTAPDGQKGHEVIFDGQQLRFPAPMSADRSGLEQARRNAEWLSVKLTILNGCPIPVIPVLVLPGWWVEATGKGPVTAINHNQLPGFLSGRAATISPERQRAIAAQLEERTRIDLSLPR
jgi:hypothetical protein